MKTTTKATKTEINNVRARIATLRAELGQELTLRCGPAAERAIREDLAIWESRLAEIAA